MSDAAGFVEFLGGRRLVLRISLREQQNQAIAGECFIDRSHRDLPPDGQRDDDEGEEHCVFERHDRQDVGDGDRFAWFEFVGDLGRVSHA